MLRYVSQLPLRSFKHLYLYVSRAIGAGQLHGLRDQQGGLLRGLGQGSLRRRAVLCAPRGGGAAEPQGHARATGAGSEVLRGHLHAKLQAGHASVTREARGASSHGDAWLSERARLSGA